VIVDAPVTTDAPTKINVGGDRLRMNDTLTTQGNPLTITATRLPMSVGLSNTGLPAIGTTNVSDAALGLITSGRLTLATSGAGNDITVTGVTAGANIGALTLDSASNIHFTEDFTATHSLNLLALTGTIDQTAGTFITTPLLTGQSGGATTLAGSVANLGSFISGGQFALADNGPLTITGPVTSVASDIKLRAIGDMTVTDGSFKAAGTVLFEVVGEARFTQTGRTTFDPLLIVIDVASSLPNLPPLDLAAQSFPDLVKGGFPIGEGTGTISLGTFVAPGANLLLALGEGGTATATNIVAGRVGVVGQGGSATLNGSLSGIVGPPAARIGLQSLSLPDSAYRFNTCTIETFCAPLVTEVPIVTVGPIVDIAFTQHVPFPASDISEWLKDPAVRPGVVYLSTSRPRRPYSDPTIDTLNIGVEDLF
jgi:hypothetical protein